MKYIIRSMIILFFVFTPLVVLAAKFEATLAQMPVYATSKSEGVIVELVKSIEKITDHKITIGVYPFARSIYNIHKNKADFHIPLIQNDMIPEEELPFYFSTETIFQVNFVLYTIKGSNVTLDNLNLHKVETDRAHIHYFPFTMIPSSSIESSLKKLSAGRIDAFVFSDVATDPVLKDFGFKNIQRSLYKIFDVKIILPKTEHGKNVDEMLTGAIRKLRHSGEFQKIMAPLNQPYDNWQP